MPRNEVQTRPGLFLLALLLAAVYATVLAWKGLAKFHSVLAGGENYVDFATGGASVERLLVTVPYLLLNVIYIVWLVVARNDDAGKRFGDVLKYAAVFLLLAVLAYPLTNDIYVYLHYGLMGWQGVNPYLTPARDFSSPVSPFLHWGQASTYGPVSESLFMVAAAAVPVSPALGVYVFKVLCALVHGSNGYLLWRFLSASPRRGTITLAYLLNPVLLTEQVAAAHVDVLLCTAVILLAWSLTCHRYFAAVLATWMGILAKTLPVIWLPLEFVFLLRQRRWRDLVLGTALAAAIVFLLALTLLPTLSTWQSLLNPGVTEMSSGSFHYLLEKLLDLFPGLEYETRSSVRAAAASITKIGFILFCLAIYVKIYFKKGYAEAELIADIGWVTLVLLLFATPWLMSWYTSILLPFAIVGRHSRRLALASFLFCHSASLIMGAGGGRTLLGILACVATLAPPVLALLLPRRQVNWVCERIALLKAGPEAREPETEGRLALSAVDTETSTPF